VNGDALVSFGVKGTINVEDIIELLSVLGSMNWIVIKVEIRNSIGVLELLLGIFLKSVNELNC